MSSRGSHDREPECLRDSARVLLGAAIDVRPRPACRGPAAWGARRDHRDAQPRRGRRGSLRSYRRCYRTGRISGDLGASHAAQTEPNVRQLRSLSRYRTQEVAGSSPAGSIALTPAHAGVRLMGQRRRPRACSRPLSARIAVAAAQGSTSRRSEQEKRRSLYWSRRVRSPAVAHRRHRGLARPRARGRTTFRPTVGEGADLGRTSHCEHPAGNCMVRKRPVPHVCRRNVAVLSARRLSSHPLARSCPKYATSGSGTRVGVAGGRAGEWAASPRDHVRRRSPWRGPCRGGPLPLPQPRVSTLRT